MTNLQADSVSELQELRRERDALRQMVQQQAERLALLEAISESSSSGITIADATRPGWPITYANPKFEEMSGYSRAELMGRKQDILLGGDLDQPELQLLIAAVHARQAVTTTIRSYRKDGSVFWNEVRLAPVFGQDGALACYIGTHQDVTEQVHFREAVHFSEERYRSVVEDQTELICRYSPDFQITFANDAYCNEFRVARKDLLGQNFFARILAADVEDAKAHIRSLTKDHPVAISEHRTAFPDGTIRWHQWTDRALFNSAGDIVEYQGVGRDVTARKEAEDKIQTQYALLQSIIENTDSLIVSLDRNWCYASFNQPHQRFMKERYGADIEIGRNMLDYITSEAERTQSRAQFERALRGERFTFEYAGPLHESNRAVYQYSEVNYSPTLDLHGKIIGITIFVRDITQRKLAEEQTRNANETLNAIIQASPLAILTFDEKQIVNIWNPAAEKIFGWAESEVRGNLLPYLNDFNRAEIGDLRDRVFKGETFSGLERQRLCKDGRRIDIDISTAALHDASGRISGVMEIIADVTDRKLAEHELALYRDHLIGLVKERTTELHKAKERVEAILNSSSDAIIMCGEGNMIQQVNPAFAQLFGCEAGDYLDRAALNLLDGEDQPAMRQALEKALAGTTVRGLEVRARRKDATRFDAEISIARIEAYEGQSGNLVLNLRDISRRKQVMAALAQERTLLRTLIDNIPAAIYVKDTDCRFVVNNVHHARSFRSTPADLVGKWDFDFFPVENAQKYYNDDRHIMENRQPMHSVEESGVDIDGNGFWALTTKAPLLNPGGEVVGLVGISIDITERKRTEEKLRTSLAFQKAILDSAGTAIISTSLDGTITSINPVAERILGYSLSDLIGLVRLDALFDAEEVALFARMLSDEFSIEVSSFSALVAEAHAGQASEHEWTLIRKDGSKFTGQSSITAIMGENDTIEGYLSLIQDITARKQAEANLRESEERFRSLVESAPDYIHQVDLDGRILATNLATTKGSLYSKEELVGHLLSEFVTPAARPDFESAVRNLARFGTIHTEVEFVRKDGAITVMDCSGSVIRDARFQPNSLIIMQHDITDRKRIEAAFRRSEADLRAIFDNVPLGLVLLDNQATVRAMNKWAITGVTLLIGYPLAVGTSLTAILAQIPMPPAYLEALQRILGGQNAQFQHTFVRQGEERTFEFRGVPIAGDEGATGRIGTCFIIEDITEHQRAEEELKRALDTERELGSLKIRFVSMASHEFRTPLATILAAADTLKAYRHKMEEPQIEKRLDKIRDQVGHLKDIIEDVLQLSRAQSGRADFTPTRVDFDAFCREIVEECHSRPDVHHQIHYQGPDKPLMATIDVMLMRNALNNLLGNAIKYSPKELSIDMTVTDRGDAIVVEVRDQGIGIPPQEHKHVFEAFHRAANVGTISGTGLGLAITKQAVDLHHGTIELKSSLEAGTTCTVTIPNKA